VFYDNRRRHRIQPPPPLPNMTRGTTLKVLGVTFTATLSASDRVRRVISDSAQSLYALRVLRHHGLGEAGLQTVFRAIVVSRLTYAALAWIGFITGTDNQRIEASPEQAMWIRLARSARLCSAGGGRGRAVI